MDGSYSANVCERTDTFKYSRPVLLQVTFPSVVNDSLLQWQKKVTDHLNVIQPLNYKYTPGQF